MDELRVLVNNLLLLLPSCNDVFLILTLYATLQSVIIITEKEKCRFSVLIE